MAIDRSVIVIPGISSTSATDKVDVSLLGQDIIFNNGLFVGSQSMTKLFPKSLYKVWSRGNKIYLFERQTTKIENVIQSVSSGINRSFKVGGSVNDFSFVKTFSSETDYQELVTRTQNDGLLFYGDNYQFSSNISNINSSFSNYNVSTNVNLASKFNLFGNKTINFYSLKPNFTTDYIQYAKPGQESLIEIVNKNFLLRLKSLFTTKEIDKQYYSYFTYLLTYWSLLGVDQEIITQFEQTIRSEKLKQKLKAPLLEQDLDLRKSSTIVNSKRYLYNNSNVEYIKNTSVYDTSRNSRVGSIAITKQDGSLLFNADNAYDYLYKIFVFVDTTTNQISAITKKSVETVGSSQDSAFLYDFANVYDSLGGYPLILSEWNLLQSQRVENSIKKYDLYIYNQTDYLDIPVTPNENEVNLLELELDSNFRTNTQGDFYVIEII